MIIDEYRRVLEEIAVIKSRRCSILRDIERLENTYKPLDLKGIDYSKQTEKKSVVDISSLIEELKELHIDLEHIDKELLSMEEQKRELRNTVDCLDSVKRKVLIYKLDGYSNKTIARTMNYSKRRIEQIIKESSIT